MKILEFRFRVSICLNFVFGPRVRSWGYLNSKPDASNPFWVLILILTFAIPLKIVVQINNNYFWESSLPVCWVQHFGATVVAREPEDQGDELLR